MHSIKGRAAKPRLVVRLPPPPHARWPSVPDAQHRRRVYAGVPRDPRRAQTEEHGRHRCPVRPFPHTRCAPHIRSDNGPEFVAAAVQKWIGAVGATTAYITPGSPWENGYVESFNARLRDEPLNGEIFCSLREAQIVIEQWRRHHNQEHPLSSLGYKPPAPEALVLAPSALPSPLVRAAPKALLPMEIHTASNYHSNWTTQWGLTRQIVEVSLVELACCPSTRCSRLRHGWLDADVLGRKYCAPL